MRTIITLSMIPFFAFSQADIKLNISNIFLYELNVSYEHIISPNATISGFTGYFYGLPDETENTNYFYLGGEARYYVSPREVADRFFLGLYSRFNTGTASTTINESGYLLGSTDYQSYTTSTNENFNAVSIGFLLGSKWVTQNGFLFGFFGGFGRNLFSNLDSYNGSGPHEELFDPSSYSSYGEYGSVNKYWDWRIGFNIGIRLGD